MKVPFVNYGLQYKNLKEEIDKAIEKVLTGGDLILRKDVDEFEKKLAEFVGTKYAVGLNSGTDALFFSLKALGIGKGDEVITVSHTFIASISTIVLKALGIGKGDEVITVSHTFIASISTIVQAGATPVLIDVKDDYLMDEGKLEEAITEKTKVIIPVHYNGRMCDMEKIMEIAKKRNLYVIEDAAQALGASFKNEKAGSLGITGCFSFYPAKILGSFGDGGALTTNSEKIAEDVKLLRDHGQKTKTEIVKYGWNSRLDNLQAAILNVKFKYLSEWIEKRREIAGKYGEGLADIEGIKLPPAPDSDSEHYDVFQNYVIRVLTPNSGSDGRAQRRNELFEFLKEKGVETLIKDPVANHLQLGLGLSHFKLPLTEQLADEVVSLPMYPELREEQIDYVINCVKEFYK